MRTSVQSGPANYFGKYIEQIVRAVPEADFEKAAEKFEPCVLVIGSKPYLPQIEAHLTEAGLLDQNAKAKRDERGEALALLHKSPESNLAWRILIGEGGQAEAKKYIVAAAEQSLPLASIIPEDVKAAFLAEAAQFVAELAKANEVDVAANVVPRVLLTSYEGSKGMSAQYVVLAGLHDGELPRRAEAVSDIEICKFLVGLTRTKKKCTVIAARRFGQAQKTLSSFIGWITPARFHRIEVNAAYWRP